jgi:hypothetical protein
MLSTYPPYHPLQNVEFWAVNTDAQVGAVHADVVVRLQQLHVYSV